MRPTAYVPVCGVAVPVYVGSPKDNPSLEGAWGCYEPEEGAIWIHEDTPKHLFPAVLVHETLHALINMSGVLYLTCASLGLNRADSRIDPWEEALVRLLTPHVAEAFGTPYTKRAVSKGRRPAPQVKGKHSRQARATGRGKEDSRGRGVRARISLRRTEVGAEYRLCARCDAGAEG